MEEVEALVSELRARANARRSSPERSPTAELCGRAAAALERVEKSRAWETQEADLWSKRAHAAQAQVEAMRKALERAASYIGALHGTDDSIAVYEEALAALAAPAKEGIKPEPPWPAGGVRNNGRREGWKAFFANQPRSDCPFPPARADLRTGYEEGWDAAASSTPESSVGAPATVLDAAWAALDAVAPNHGLSPASLIAAIEAARLAAGWGPQAEARSEQVDGGEG